MCCYIKSCQVRSGYIRLYQVLSDYVKSCWVRSGSVRLGQVGSGLVMFFGFKMYLSHIFLTLPMQNVNLGEVKINQEEFISKWSEQRKQKVLVSNLVKWFVNPAGALLMSVFKWF